MSKYKIITKSNYNYCGKEIHTYYQVRKTINLLGLIPYSYYVSHGYACSNRFFSKQEAQNYIKSQVKETRIESIEEYRCN